MFRVLFSLLLILALLLVVSCQRVSSQKEKKPKDAKQIFNYDVYSPPVKLAELEDKTIEESSGLATSHTSPGCYWTHNDAGNGPFIHAFDSSGRRRGVWRVMGAASEDWEDISSGPGPLSGLNYLYIADTGDNTNSRAEIVVYRVPEPTIPERDPGSPQTTEKAETIRLSYPDGSHDSEAMLIHPQTGRIYLVTKVSAGNPTVYAADLPKAPTEAVKLQRVGELNRAEGFDLISGGAISPDGTRAVVCDYDRGYEFVLKDANASFDSIWNQTPIKVDLGKRKHGESISYRLDGKALMATSERLPAPLIQVSRR